jgi:arginine utilization protein RocB
MQRSAKEVMDIYLEVAREAVQDMEHQLADIWCRQGIKGQKTNIRLLTYEELEQYAIKKYGLSYINSLKEEILEELDEREMSIRIVDQLAIHCQELAPMVILFFSPPYYPAVHSSNDETICELMNELRSFALEKFAIQVKPVAFFNGISDLSYVSYKDTMDEWETFEKNTLVWGKRYYIPFTEMSQLDAPVFNLGPFGKDAHKKTERLNIRNAFEQVPALLEHLVKTHMHSTKG